MPDAYTITRAARGRGPHRRRVVGVLGSGETSDERADQIGRLVAELGCDLLTGGGGGVMAAASRAFVETPGRNGIAIGIIPGFVDRLDELEARTIDSTVLVEYDVDPRYPNPWVELAIHTHLPHSGASGTFRTSRNHLNVLSSTALVALPGGEGTWSEMWLALRYGTPLIAYGNHTKVPDGVQTTNDSEEVRRFLAGVLQRLTAEGK